MIRATKPDDTAALMALADATGLFQPHEIEALGEVLADYFGGNINDGHVCITDDEDGPRGFAYYAPAPMTDRTWYLYWIAVRPDCQGQGLGAKLLWQVERALTKTGQRVLVVETSGLPTYSRTRAFYRKCGYDEEARVRDFYKAGDDMVVFRKALTTG